MKANIVYIKTEEDAGTGILYPCRYDNNELVSSNYQSFIIFTNSHVLSKFECIDYKKRDIKDEIILKIYDANGDIVDSVDIQKIYVHNVQFDSENYNDVAALLVFINKRVYISIENKILDRELKNRDTLYMEGYPEVMIEDSISQKVQLEGVAKDIFPKNDKMGVYQIVDDYHWYNNKKDLKLMEGFSGSPVYVEKDGKFYLVGMNQSVSNIDTGENPFKLIYYIKIQHIIDRLRETNCILFKKSKDNSYIIEWIYGSEDKVNEFPYEPSLFLVGSSGAGKSSFARDFAYNSSKLQVTNDGQTTRTNIIYEYSIFCEHPRVVVTFLSRQEFIKKLKEFNYDKIMLYAYLRIFDLTKIDYITDTSYYIKDFYYFLKACGLEPSSNILENIENTFLPQADNGKLGFKIGEIYLATIKYFLKYFEVNNVKYFCDRAKIENLKNSYKTEIKKSDVKKDEDKLNVFEKNLKKAWDKYEDEITESIVIIIYKYCSTNYSFQDFQTDIYDNLEHLGTRSSLLNKVDQNSFSLPVMDEEFLKLALNSEGFFNIEEMKYIFPDNLNDNEIYDIIICELKNSDIPADINNIDILEKTIDSIYGNVYDKIFNEIDKNYNISKKNLYSKQRISTEINLTDINDDNINKLTYCLQVNNGNSLTGMVDNVKIVDRISNEYALLLSELKISKITLLDTCGLDHIERSTNIKAVLEESIVNYERSEKIRFEDFNILYLKKLDSGKPDELRTILPIVFEVIPQSPVYCVFTGIDNFYKNDIKNIQQLSWDSENIKSCPKAIQYIISNENKEELISNIRASDSRKNNLYLVLKNNLVPYCGLKELVKSNLGYYENNYTYIRKMLVSIIRKEYSSLGIIDIKSINQILNTNRSIIEDLLLKIFENASVYNWDYNKIHNATARANFTRLKDHDQLGFARTYNHLWSSLFYNSYNYVVTKESQDFLNLFPKNKEVIESTLLNMISSFLGRTSYLYYFENIDDIEDDTINETKDDESRFRNILQSMYQQNDSNGEPIYKYNIFEDDLTGDEYAKYIKCTEILEDVYNFTKGYLLNQDIKKQFVDLFINVFEKQLNKDNQAKAKSLVEVDLNFSKALNDLEKEFIDKYSPGNNEEGIQMFNRILSYRFENNI